MQTCVVWYTKTSEWRASKSMSVEEAETYAENLQTNGFRTQIVPRPEVTLKDILEG